MTKWTLIRVSAETKFELDKIKDDTADKIRKRLDLEEEGSVRPSYDLVIIRLLRFWKKW